MISGIVLRRLRSSTMGRLHFPVFSFLSVDVDYLCRVVRVPYHNGKGFASLRLRCLSCETASSLLASTTR